jgi:hypothetical protein
MDCPLIPSDENKRITSLKMLNILDSPEEERYDRITKTVAQMFNVPIALISLIDSERQWFKSRFGLEVSETPRDISFCGHAILDDNIFIVPDTLKDSRFIDNPLVTCAPNIRFYAGQPISSPSGERIGTLCIIDIKPRTFDVDNVMMLKKIASIIELELANKNHDSRCPDSGFVNKLGFHQLADHALTVCRQSNMPFSVAYFYIGGLARLKEKDEAQYRHTLEIIKDSFQLVLTNSDLVAHYDDCGFVSLLSNTSHSSALKYVSIITNIVQGQLMDFSLKNLNIVSGIVEDNGYDSLDDLIFNSFMIHYQNSAF